MKKKQILTLDAIVKQHKGNVRAAAAAIGHDYMQIWRWHSRQVYAHENSATRRELLGKGVELPHRPKAAA